MGWLIGLAILILLMLLPISFRFVYRELQSGVWVLVGPFSFCVYPKKKKARKAAANRKTDKPKEKKGGRYRDFLPVIQAIIDFLSEFRRKIRVKRLEFKVVLADEDPSDLAVNYGRSWAALGTLMPQLERLFVIKKRNIEVECDFTAEETLIYARIDATITLIRTLYLLSKHGVKVLKQLLELRKLRKGGAQL